MKVRRSTRTLTVAATRRSMVLNKLNGMLERTFSSATPPSTRESYELRPSTIAKTRRSIEYAIKRKEVLERKREARRSRQEGLIEVATTPKKLAQPRRRTITKIVKQPEKLTQENAHSRTAVVIKIPKQPEKLVQENPRNRSTAIAKITKQPVKRDLVKPRSRTVGQVIKKAPRTRTFVAPRRRKEPLIFGPETEVVTPQTRYRSRTAGAPSSPRRQHIITITVNDPAPQKAMEARRSRTSVDVSQAQRQEEKEDADDSFAEAWNWSFHPETYDGYVAPVEQARLEIGSDAENSFYAQMMMDLQDSFTDF